MVEVENQEANELEIYREIKKDEAHLEKFLKLQKKYEAERFRYLCMGRKIGSQEIDEIAKRIGCYPNAIEAEILVTKRGIKYLEDYVKTLRIK